MFHVNSGINPDDYNGFFLSINWSLKISIGEKLKFLYESEWFGGYSR